MQNRPKAVGLISGGLDSMLAAEVVKRLGFDVIGINMYTGFCITEQKRRLGGTKGSKAKENEALKAGAQVEIPIEIVDISKEYLDILTNPKHGYGKNVNPCIDCRIFMLRKAKEIMEAEGASFVFTGEVVGQRPMSQRRHTMQLIEKESGMKGRIVRPLSAKKFPATDPEREGLFSRDQLYAFSGRGRRAQLDLAEEFGMTDIPQPAGGCCFLTDESYAKKFRDFFVHKPPDHRVTYDDLILLRFGRHFRLPGGIKFIIGRDEQENAALERFIPTMVCLQLSEANGPTTLVDARATDRDLEIIASVVAYHSKSRADAAVSVDIIIPGETVRRITVSPISSREELEPWRI